jgi:hypothetical protein
MTLRAIVISIFIHVWLASIEIQSHVQSALVFLLERAVPIPCTRPLAYRPTVPMPWENLHYSLVPCRNSTVPRFAILCLQIRVEFAK